MADKHQLTPEDRAALLEYMTKAKALDKREPEYLLDAKEQEAWEAWNAEGVELNKQYHDVIVKVLYMSMEELADRSPESVMDIIQYFTTATTDMTDVRITIKRPDKVDYPLDKVNSQIWNLLERDTGGQIALRAEKEGSKKQINIYYSIDFDELGQGITLTKKLTPFDKRVYIAVSALFTAGNTVITLTQIYYAMGYTGRPGESNLEKISASISKMTGARVYVTNQEEVKAGYNYRKFVYDGSLLPMERVTSVVNGKQTEAAIRIFREPPIMSFARQRNQLTTVDIKLLQSPISKTDANLLIEDYLIERIAHAKKGKQARRILYKTLYEKAGITTAMQKQRLPGKVERYLKHFLKCGLISGYTLDNTGINFAFDDAAKGKAQGGKR